MKFLITAPINDDLTRDTTAVWARKLTNFAMAQSLAPSVMIGPDVTRKVVEAELKNSVGCPGLFCFLDHGLSQSLTGADSGPLIDSQNASLLSNKFAYVVACHAGSLLGKVMIEQGAAGFLGFSNTVDIVLSGVYPRVVGRCLVSGLIAMLRDDASAGEAQAIIVNRFDAAMHRLERQKSSDVRLVALNTFRHNRNAVTLLGDPAWRWRPAFPNPQI